MRALFVCYGGSHAATIAPVVAELRRRGDVDCVALALTTAGPLFARRGIDHRGFADYVDPGRDGDALQLGRSLLGTVQGADVGIAPEESIAYLGLSMRDAIDDLGEQEARARFARIGRHAFLPRRTLARIIALERPRVVVATNSPKSERAAILEGNAAGLETLIVPDLFAFPEWESYSPFEAKWFAAMSDITRANLTTGHGAAPERVIVTGQPAFDKSGVPDRGACRRYVEATVGVPVAATYALVLTSWDPLTQAATGSPPSSSGSRRALPAIIQALPQGFRAVVKPHPSEPDIAYRAIAEAHATAVLAPGRADVDQLLRGADLVVAATPTTAVVDALVLDRPTMAVTLTGTSHLPFADLGVPVAAALEEIPRRIAEAMGDPAERRARRAELARVNAGGAAHVADLVTALASGALAVPQSVSASSR